LETIKTHFIFDTVLFVEIRNVYEILWKNEVEPDRPHMIIWRMCIACWLAKAKTHTHRIFNITTFPGQQYLGERISQLTYT